MNNQKLTEALVELIASIQLCINALEVKQDTETTLPEKKLEKEIVHNLSELHEKVRGLMSVKVVEDRTTVLDIFKEIGIDRPSFSVISTLDVNTCLGLINSLEGV
jgi:hypothetical protein